jgi:hypothetical protein
LPAALNHRRRALDFRLVMTPGETRRRPARWSGDAWRVAPF